MNKEKLEGKGKEAMGSTREKAGQMTGNREMESKGTEQKYEGKGEGMVGKGKDAAHNVKDKVTGH